MKLVVAACVASLIPLSVVAISIYQLATTPFDLNDVVYLVIDLALAAFIIGFPLSGYLARKRRYRA